MIAIIVGVAIASFILGWGFGSQRAFEWCRETSAKFVDESNALLFAKTGKRLSNPFRDIK